MTLLAFAWTTAALATDPCAAARDVLTSIDAVPLVPHDQPAGDTSARCGLATPLLPWLDGDAPLPEGVYRAELAGRTVVVRAELGSGTGRYWTLHAVHHDGHACLGGTTVGWRHLETELLRAAGLAPLPVLADVDGDGQVELVQPVGLMVEPEFGNAGFGLGLLARRFDGRAWVADVDATRALATRLAAVHRQLRSTSPRSSGFPHRQLVHLLEAWTAGREPCPYPE